MSDALAAAVRADAPLARVLAFSRRFGRDTTALAMHAALPLGLSPELVHLLRVNFVPRAPFIAEADLLLSPLCEEVGGGMYVMDADVRELLLAEMARTPEYGDAHLRRVALFLRLWAARAQEDAADEDAREHLRVQQWVALAYADPARAAEELAGALRAGVERADRPEVARVARLTTVLSAPLAAQVELRRYAGAVERMAASDVGERTVPQRIGTGEVAIGRARLPSLDRVIRLWHPAPASSPFEIAQGADLPPNAPFHPPSNTEEPPGQQQTADDRRLADYRVARVVVVGNTGVGKTSLISRITGRQIPSRGGPDPYSARWIVPGRVGEGERDVVFIDPPPGNLLPFEIAEASVLLIVAGGSAGLSAAEWVERFQGNQPVLVVSTTRLDQAEPDPALRELREAEARVHGVYSADPRTGAGVEAVQDALVRAIDWSRVPAAQNREDVDFIEGRLQARLEDSVMAPFDNRLRNELTQLMWLPAGSTSHDLDPALKCIQTRGTLRVVGAVKPTIIRGDLYADCAGATWRAVERANNSSGLPAAALESLVADVQRRQLGASLREVWDADLLHLVVHDLVERQWAHLLEADGEAYVVIPSLFAPPHRPSPRLPSHRPLVEASWTGPVNDVFLLLLVRLSRMGRVEPRREWVAYVDLVYGHVVVEGTFSDGQAHLALSVTDDVRDLDPLRQLFREVIRTYRPAGTEFEIDDVDQPPTGSLQEPPAGVDASRACVVFLADGLATVGETLVDFDEIWEELFLPAISAATLPDGRSLVAIRSEIPPGSEPLPEWMKSVPLLAVDVTMADPARLAELGLLPPRGRMGNIRLFRAHGRRLRPWVWDSAIWEYAHGSTQRWERERDNFTRIFNEAVRVSDGGTSDGEEKRPANISGPVCMAAIAPRSAKPGETIEVRMLVYEKGAQEKAAGHLRDLGIDPDAVQWGRELGRFPLDSSITLRFGASWDAAYPYKRMEWKGGWASAEATFTVPTDFAQPEARLSFDVSEEDFPHPPVELVLQISAPARHAEHAPAFVAAYAPRSAAPGETIEVRMVVFEEQARTLALGHFAELGIPGDEISWGPGLDDLSPGTRVSLRFGAAWDEMQHYRVMEWNGEWLAAETTFTVPADFSEPETQLSVEVLGEGRGSRMAMTLQIESSSNPAVTEPPQQQSAQRTAYLCYASEDGERVARHLPAIAKAEGLDPWDLDPVRGSGLRTELITETRGDSDRRIAQEICSRDLFLLFLSRAFVRRELLESSWAQEEWRAALRCAKSGKPEIRIYTLDEVLPELIPEELREFKRTPLPEPSHEKHGHGGPEGSHGHPA